MGRKSEVGARMTIKADSIQTKCFNRKRSLNKADKFMSNVVEKWDCFCLRRQVSDDWKCIYECWMLTVCVGVPVGLLCWLVGV